MINRYLFKFLQFPGIVTRRSTNFRVTEPGDRPIAGYCYPEIGTKKILFCEYLRENENIFKNILGGYSRA